ncbi:hypothetical protein PTSG_09415 [Salpingoeca rosetta]|uniref:PH domain-containing protein n=1 Tax=Salpingoeca rosetta (strain ATCC 50818 / BSB-021) TaxID=946362 RepID=F2UMK0_SALR5|nr:uncharacterized protein PTSG_09415 [Salpingoeca rosetta]EGD78349.1 hypothetical protein PTSG_09415 [Salpingoeca rosetta]|eukprot:XP_004989672.1 hypothetical protein PTSG_09415 [Salpingoeca rosetta]
MAARVKADMRRMMEEKARRRRTRQSNAVRLGDGPRTTELPSRNTSQPTSTRTSDIAPIGDAILAQELTKPPLKSGTSSHSISSTRGKSSGRPSIGRRRSSFAPQDLVNNPFGGDMLLAEQDEENAPERSVPKQHGKRAPPPVAPKRHKGAPVQRQDSRAALGQLQTSTERAYSKPAVTAPRATDKGRRSTFKFGEADADAAAEDDGTKGVRRRPKKQQQQQQQQQQQYSSSSSTAPSAISKRLTRRASVESCRESAYMADALPYCKILSSEEDAERETEVDGDDSVDESRMDQSDHGDEGSVAVDGGNKDAVRGMQDNSADMSADSSYYEFLVGRRRSAAPSATATTADTATSSSSGVRDARNMDQAEGGEDDDDDVDCEDDVNDADQSIIKGTAIESVPRTSSTDSDDAWHEVETLAEFAGTPVPPKPKRHHRGAEARAAIEHSHHAHDKDDEEQDVQGRLKGSGNRQLSMEQREFATALSKTASVRGRSNSICMDAPVSQQQHRSSNQADSDDDGDDDDMVVPADSSAHSRHLRASQPNLSKRRRASNASASRLAARSEVALDRVGLNEALSPPDSRMMSPRRAYLCSPNFERTASVLVGRKSSDTNHELERHEKVITATERMCQFYSEADSIEPLYHRKAAQVARAAILAKSDEGKVDTALTRTVTLTQIRLRLHWWATIPNREASSFFLFVTLRYKDQSFATRMVRVDGSSDATEVSLRDTISFENVEPGFTVEAQVYCYTFTDPERVQAQRRVSTPKKAMERMGQAARHIRNATPRKLKKFRQIISSKLSELADSRSSRAGSRGPATPERPARPRTREGTTRDITKDFVQLAEFKLTQSDMGDHHLDLTLVHGEDHPVGDVVFVSSRISAVQTDDYEGFLTFKTDCGWERFWTVLKNGVMSQYTQIKPRQLLATTDLSTLPPNTHVQRVSRQECARHHSFDLRALSPIAEEIVLLRVAGDSKEHQTAWRAALSNTLTRLQAWSTA